MESPFDTYQRHLRAGNLAYQWDPDANKAVFFPRVSTNPRVEWRVSAGSGTVYSTTYVTPRDGAPYNVALIDMDEGFRLMSRVEGVPPDAVQIGTRVRARVLEAEGGERYPVFAATASSG
jgi:uncharacterized OB-fold protein